MGSRGGGVRKERYSVNHPRSYREKRLSVVKRKPATLDDSSPTKQSTTITEHLIPRLITTRNPPLIGSTPAQYQLDQQSFGPTSPCCYRLVTAVSFELQRVPVMVTSNWRQLGARPLLKSFTILLALVAPAPTVQLSQQLCSSQNTGSASNAGTSK